MMGQHICSSSISISDEATFCAGTGPHTTGGAHAGQSQNIRKHKSAQLHGTALPSYLLSWEPAFVSSLEDIPASWLKQHRLFCAHPNALLVQNISLHMESGRAFVNLPPSL